MQAVVTVIANQYRVFRFQVNDVTQFMLANVDQLAPGDALDFLARDPAFDSNRSQAGGAVDNALVNIRLRDQFLDFDALPRRRQQHGRHRVDRVDHAGAVDAVHDFVAKLVQAVAIPVGASLDFGRARRPVGTVLP